MHTSVRSRFGSRPRRSSGDDGRRDAPATAAQLIDGHRIHIDGFDPIELIGSGGFSRVYRARQDGFDRDVAIKVLSIGLESASKRKSFERECRAMGVLSQHPNIVTVFNAAFTNPAFTDEAADADRRPCIVMQYYGGGTLGDRVKANGPLSLQGGLSLGVQMAGALETAHRNGVVHRDIKPTNLFVDDYGQPALGDFGISSFDDDRTITGGGGGLTVHYAPPELIEGDSATAASDVYSLAATLFTLLAGRRPFPRPDGQSVGELARRILLEPPPRLDAEGVPPALVDLLRRAMAKRPHQRPATAAALGRELQAIQASLGFAVTEMTLPGEPGGVASEGPEPVLPARTNDVAAETIARAEPRIDGRARDGRARDGRAQDVSAPDAPQSPPSGVRLSRKGRGVLVAGVSIIGLGAAALALAPSRGVDAQAATSSGDANRGTLTDDDFFAAPSTPSDISIVETADPLVLEVSWSAESDDGGAATRFQVQRVDTAAGVVIEATEASATIELRSPDEPVCVVVRAVGDGGRLSTDSDVTCR